MVISTNTSVANSTNVFTWQAMLLQRLCHRCKSSAPCDGDIDVLRIRHLSDHVIVLEGSIVVQDLRDVGAV